MYLIFRVLINYTNFLLNLKKKMVSQVFLSVNNLSV